MFDTKLKFALNLNLALELETGDRVKHIQPSTSLLQSIDMALPTQANGSTAPVSPSIPARSVEKRRFSQDWFKLNKLRPQSLNPLAIDKASTLSEEPKPAEESSSDDIDTDRAERHAREMDAHLLLSVAGSNPNSPIAKDARRNATRRTQSTNNQSQRPVSSKQPVMGGNDMNESPEATTPARLSLADSQAPLVRSQPRKNKLLAFFSRSRSTLSRKKYVAASPVATGSVRKRRLSVTASGIQIVKPVRKLSPLTQKKRVSVSRHASVLEKVVREASQEVPLSKVGYVAGQLKDVNSKDVDSLKKALTNPKQAAHIIQHVREMNVDGKVPQQSDAPLVAGSKPRHEAEDKLREILGNDKENARAPRRRMTPLVTFKGRKLKDKEQQHVKEGSKSACRPMRAFCLDVTEREAEDRNARKSKLTQPGQDKNPPTKSTAKMSAASDSMSPINLLSGMGAPRALDAAGVLGALGDASGALIKSTEIDAGIQPPLDRIAVFIFWWGLEITLPQASMSYLSTAHSVSNTIIQVLSVMAVTSLPELSPVLAFIATTIETEYKAIQAVNQGDGVVLAATWILPVALVPRAWDYSTDPDAVPSTLSIPTSSADDQDEDDAEVQQQAVTSSTSVAKKSEVKRRSSKRSAPSSPPAPPPPRTRISSLPADSPQRKSEPSTPISGIDAELFAEV